MRLGELFPRLMFASNPVFDPSERVPSGSGGDGLPAELVGKSPAEIARYYQQREESLRREFATRQNDPPPSNPSRTTPPAQPTSAEFFNNPTEATNKIIEARAISREEWDRVSSSIGPSLIWAAREQTRQRHSDFSRVEARITDIMKQVPQWQHTDPVMWETVYTQAKGLEYDRLSAEDRVKPVTTSEPVAPGATAAPPETDLNKIPGPADAPHKTAGFIADKLGLSHDNYRKAKATYETTGLLPLTLDTRRQK